MKIKNLPTAKI